MVIWRPCLFILSALLLASCATRDPSSLAYGKSDVGIDEAFLLPADRSIIGITQERASNAITQTIALNTNSGQSGENFFRVTFIGPVNPEGASEHTLSYMPLTEGRITRELRSEMAGIAMSRSPYYVQNNYGPFSYATGTTSGGDSCIYAWQQIRSAPNTQNFFQNRGRIDLRLRLCETGATQEKLLAAMYEFTINATIGVSSWNPLGEPAGPSPELGRPGNPLLAPSVNSNLSGPFPATDLNTDRLNTALQKTDRPTPARSTTPSVRSAPQRAPEIIQPTSLPAVNSLYPQAPVIVPAPQQVNAMPQAPQVPSPSAIQNPQGSPSTIVVPSPCGSANNQSSGISAGTLSAVCQ